MTKTARVHFARVRLECEVPVGHTILQAAKAAGAPEGSHCGGVCACSSCHIYIRSGSERLSPMQSDERDMLALAAKARRDSSRLGCQTHIVLAGRVTVEIAEESFRTFLDDNPAERDQALARWLSAR